MTIGPNTLDIAIPGLANMDKVTNGLVHIQQSEQLPTSFSETLKATIACPRQIRLDNSHA
jgi:hypothetical protein